MLQLFGAAYLRVGGEVLRFRGDGTQLFLEIEHPRPLFRALSDGQPGRSLSLESLRQLAARLHAAGLTLHVLSRGGLLLVAGRDAKPGLRDRLLRLPHVALGSNDALIRLLLS